MRYVGLKEFLALPQGTVYEEVRKCSTGDGMLLIKGETISDRDWVECPLSGTIMLMSEKHSEGMAGALHLWENPENSAPVYTDVWGRNGKYPEDGEVFFYVYETADILKIITMLGGALLMQGVDLAFNSEKEEVSQMQMTDAMVPTTQALRAAQWMVSATRPGSRNAEMFEEPKSVHGQVSMGLKAINAQLGEPRGIPEDGASSIVFAKITPAKTLGEEIQEVTEVCRWDQAVADAKLYSPLVRNLLDKGHNMEDLRETRPPQGSSGREILNTIRQIERVVDVSASLVVEMTFTLKRWGDVTLAIPSGVNEWFSHLEAELRAVLVQDLNPEEQAEAFLRTIYEVTATDMPIITLTVKGTPIQLFQETVPFSGQPWSYGFIKDGESFRQKTLDALVKTILEIV